MADEPFLVVSRVKRMSNDDAHKMDPNWNKWKPYDYILQGGSFVAGPMIMSGPPVSKAFSKLITPTDTEVTVVGDEAMMETSFMGPEVEPVRVVRQRNQLLPGQRAVPKESFNPWVARTRANIIRENQRIEDLHIHRTQAEHRAELNRLFTEREAERGRAWWREQDRLAAVASTSNTMPIDYIPLDEPLAADTQPLLAESFDEITLFDQPRPRSSTPAAGGRALKRGNIIELEEIGLNQFRSRFSNRPQDTIFQEEGIHTRAGTHYRDTNIDNISGIDYLEMEDIDLNEGFIETQELILQPNNYTIVPKPLPFTPPLNPHYPLHPAEGIRPLTPAVIKHKKEQTRIRKITPAKQIIPSEGYNLREGKVYPLAVTKKKRKRRIARSKLKHIKKRLVSFF